MRLTILSEKSPKPRTNVRKSPVLLIAGWSQGNNVELGGNPLLRSAVNGAADGYIGAVGDGAAATDRFGK